MIKKIYIDNFRCLTNFSIEPGDFQLWLGDNGSGKTSVLDALRCIQRLMKGEHIEDIFSRKNLTIWDKRLDQTIGFSITLDDNQYEYECIIEHWTHENRLKIKREEVKWNGSRFFLFDGDEAHLFRIQRGEKEVVEGAAFIADWNRSMIPTIAERRDNLPLLKFRETIIDKWLFIQPIPLLVEQVAESEVSDLSKYAENFAAWYRHIIQENSNIGYAIKEQLADVLHGYEKLGLTQAGDARRLIATFRINGKDIPFDFMVLSDGQRQLIVLYTILESLRAGSFSSVFFDEPDNFVSLREIQPWIDNLNDICDDEEKQAIIISHHPEIINTMVSGMELFFSRKNGAHAIVKPFPTVGDLLPAEIAARGWDDE